jgi:tRNA threonylcarbamoyladenosine biosynthesis protein TsaE
MTEEKAHDHPPLVPPLAEHGALAMNEEELRDWGHRFGRATTLPMLVTLTGDLGAGKTTLVQAICRGFGITDEVTSPTFALVHEYSAPRGLVHHLDLYRLENAGQLDALAWDEIVSGQGLVLVEWPERAEGRVPGGHVALSLQHLPNEPQKRLFYAGWHA